MNYIPNTNADRVAMLAKVGVAALAELFQDVPEQRRFPTLDLPPALSDKVEAIRQYKEMTGCSLKQAKVAVELNPQAETQGRGLNTADLVSQIPEDRDFLYYRYQPPGCEGLFAGAGMVTCLTIGFILFVFGGVLAIIMMQPGSPLRPRMNAMAPAEMVSTAPNNNPDVVSQIYHLDDEVDKIVWVETNPKKTRWVSSPFSGDERAELMAVDGSRC